MYLWDGGRGLSMGENETISERRNFLRNGKIICEEDSWNLLKSCLSFGGCLEGANKEKMGRQQKEDVL